MWYNRWFGRWFGNWFDVESQEEGGAVPDFNRTTRVRKRMIRTFIRAIKL